MVSSNFSAAKDAFAYFASFGTSKQVIYGPGFEEAMENLFPKRFSLKDKQQIWRMISTSGIVNRASFYRLFNQVEFQGSVSLTT